MKRFKQLLITIVTVFSIFCLSAINSLDELERQKTLLTQQLSGLEDIARDRGETIAALLRGNSEDKQRAFALLRENREDLIQRMNLQDRIDELERQIGNF